MLLSTPKLRPIAFPSIIRGCTTRSCKGATTKTIRNLHNRPSYKPSSKLRTTPQLAASESPYCSRFSKNTQLKDRYHSGRLHPSAARSFHTSNKMTSLKSWVPIPPKSDFSLANIPFGIITSRNSQTQKRPAIAIGSHALDLLAFSKGNGFSKLPSITENRYVFEQSTLNDFAALGRQVHREVRAYIQDILSESTSHPEILKDNAELQKAALLPKGEFKNHLPMRIGDYTDFFAGRNHAVNLG